MTWKFKIVITDRKKVQVSHWHGIVDRCHKLQHLFLAMPSNHILVGVSIFVIILILVLLERLVWFEGTSPFSCDTMVVPDPVALI